MFKITHTAPTMKQFEEWGVQEAYPTFYVDISFYDEDKRRFYFRIKITGHYYCCGSRNFEIEKYSLSSCSIDESLTKEYVSNLLDNSDLENLIKESIDGSMIRDPIAILELLDI